MIRHYLDHNATAPVRPEVIDAVSSAMARVGNASSVHDEGRAAHAQVEDAREAVRRLVNGPVNGVVFTSGGTESIHAAIHGVAAKIARVFVSAIEHAAVTANAEATGLPVETIPVSPSGAVDLDGLKARLDAYDVNRDGGFLVCVMAANNETGAVQPIAEIADLVHDAGGLLFVDAAQAAGKIPVNFVMAGADMMSLTGHKFGGPLGVGALVLRPNLALEPVLR
ncbi:MAG: aminotransferase class V-fold PLP-dependent enzyme, partial [Pseudomonadota bacterium]